MDGAKSLVQTAERFGIATALVTSSDRASVRHKIGNHPWVNHMQLMVCGDDPDLKAGKPAPDPFLLGSDRLKVRPEECWAFEDSRAGCESALTAGCLVWRLLRTTEIDDQLDHRGQGLLQSDRLVVISQLSEAQHCLESVVSKDD